MLTFSVAGSTRTIALRPPSVIHGAPSGPTITPCGADPAPSFTMRVAPVFGSRYPSSPVRCAVYQTPPSAAGATSCGPWPRPTGNSASLTAAASGVRTAAVPAGGGGGPGGGARGGARAAGGDAGDEGGG